KERWIGAMRCAYCTLRTIGSLPCAQRLPPCLSPLASRLSNCWWVTLRLPTLRTALFHGDASRLPDRFVHSLRQRPEQVGKHRTLAHHQFRGHRHPRQQPAVLGHVVEMIVGDRYSRAVIGVDRIARVLIFAVRVLADRTQSARKSTVLLKRKGIELDAH